MPIGNGERIVVHNGEGDLPAVEIFVESDDPTKPETRLPTQEEYDRCEGWLRREIRGILLGTKGW
jgi:hypothetical protein